MILDSIGELAHLFQIATVVFVGGSLVDQGGHNILEPAVHGKAIMFGPHMENFAEIADAFLRTRRRCRWRARRSCRGRSCGCSAIRSSARGWGQPRARSSKRIAAPSRGRIAAITALLPPLRVPMVALVGNRALDDPGAFGVEHNDALVVRDLGWMLCWIDTSQEALDTTLIAYRVAEDRRVFLPLAISADGAFLTHSQALTLVPPKEKVDRFLPRYDRGDLLLHPDNPITVAPQANEDWVIEIRRQNDEAMKRAYGVIEEAYADFRRVFGRGPENPWFEEYMLEDAEVVLVGMGTISLPMKVAIREMRSKGKKVGLLRLRWFRPFPTERIVAALSRAQVIGVIDRDYSFGSPFASGVVANEIRAAMYNADRRPPLLSFICGLGGREVTLEDVNKAVEMCYGAAKAGKSDARTHWLGVRE